jgi:pimeloyl-ACP methyl ester carboxylesterase
MPKAKMDAIELYYEVTGSGPSLVFIHEFAGDYRSWESQVRFFSRRYQVITYNHRGYPPSEVPPDPSAYSERILVEDLSHLLRHLNISKTHVVGLSMGGNIALHFSLLYPELCWSSTIASSGTGSANREDFEQRAKAMIGLIREKGMRVVAESLSTGPARVRLREKDPRGWREFREQLAEHSAIGSALVFQGVQLSRPSLFTLETELRQIRIPTLLMVGDEDEPCIEPMLFMRRHIPNSQLMMFPRTGHGINLEEPDLFNRTLLDFLTAIPSG